jgi:peptide/nickel transport system permease protein
MARAFFAWLRSDLRAALSLSFLLALLLMSLAAPWIAPWSPTAQNIDIPLADANAEHLLGTDDLGRDVSNGGDHMTMNML